MEKTTNNVNFWSPDPELFQEILEAVKLYTPIKYVFWGKEGVMLTIKDRITGERSIVTVPNETEEKETVLKVKGKITELQNNEYPSTHNEIL